MTPSAEVTLSILGSRFRVSSPDARMVALAAELWEPFVAEDGGEGETATIEMRREGWRLDTPPDPPIAATDPWIVAAAARNSLSRRAIRVAQGIVPLHGAAVERHGTFLVFAGPPKAGKTTLLLELLERGWLLVTDDLVPLDPGTLTATPFPKPLSVRDPARWREAARRWNVPAWLPPPQSVGLIPAAAVPRSTAGTYRPSALVFTRFAEGAEPQVRRLSPAETVAWCGDNLHSRGPETPGVLPVLAGLGRSVPGYAMTYTSTPEALELLESVLRGLGSME